MAAPEWRGDAGRSHSHGADRVSLPVTAPVKHVWIALLVVYVVWGSTYFGIKVAVETIPPLLAGGSRFLVASLLLAGDSPARATRLSTLAGLVGLLLVVAPGLGAGSTALGLAVMISATMSWTLGSFLSNRLSLPSDPFVASVYEMGLGGAFLLLAAAGAGEYGDLAASSFALDSVLAWAYLVVMGSLVGFSAYAWLLRVAPISLVVTHQYVNPLVAIALGMAFLGERPSPWTLAGAALVIGAVYVAIKSEFPKNDPRP